MTPTPDVPPAAPAPSGWRPPWTVLIILGLTAGAVLLAQLTMPDEPEPTPAPLPPTAFVAPLADTWPVLDATPVIGVSVGTRHRAYLLANLWSPQNHVLNDTLGTTPLTVTFCNLNNCTCAFTGEDGAGPLRVTNGGRHPTLPRQMVLLHGGRRFDQETLEPLDKDKEKPFPYKPAEAMRTTWAEWHAKHPDTELYANGRVYTPVEK